MSPLLLSAAPLTLAASAGSALPDHPGLLQNLEFQAVGLAIVMTALFCLYLLCAVVGQIFIRLDARQQARAAEHAASPTAPEALEPPIAVIAAAVAAVLEQPHRVVEVKASTQHLSWSLEGRRQIFATRMPRR